MIKKGPESVLGTRMDCQGDGDLSSILLTRSQGRNSDHNSSTCIPSPFLLPDSDHDHDSAFNIMIMLMQAQNRTPQINVDDLPNVMGTRPHARSPCCMQELSTGKSHSLRNKAQLAAATSPKRSRKALQKRTVCVSAVGSSSSSSSSSSSAGSRGSMGESYLPRDMWAWRKYGQKPIKGSPHPRGYYKCSSSKGCPARKQVERSQTEPNMLLITYTSEHNHPFPTHRNALAGSTRPNLHPLTNSTATIALAEEANQLIQAEANTREVQISPNRENSEEKVVLESSLAALDENYEESKELLLHRYLLSELQDHLDHEGIMAVCSTHIGAPLIERVDYEEDEADLFMEESAPLDPFYNLFEWSSSPLS